MSVTMHRRCCCFLLQNNWQKERQQTEECVCFFISLLMETTKQGVLPISMPIHAHSLSDKSAKVSIVCHWPPAVSSLSQTESSFFYAEIAGAHSYAWVPWQFYLPGCLVNTVNSGGRLVLCRSHWVTEGTDVSKPFRAGLKLNFNPSCSSVAIFHCSVVLSSSLLLLASLSFS